MNDLKFSGFVGASYKLDSVNVDAQRCVNLYPEIIESGKGKEAQVAYLRSTPGLELFQTVGDGPIRLIHVDSVGRILVASGNELYRISKRAEWKFRLKHIGGIGLGAIDQSTDVDVSDNFITVSYAMPTGTKVRVSSTGTLPTGLSASTDYYVFPNVYGSSLKLATTAANAADSVAVDITGTGSGTMTVYLKDPGELELYNISHDEDVDFDNNTITISNHGLFTGLKTQLGTLATPLPGGLAVETDYYIISSDSNTIKLATSYSNAIAGTAIDLTAVSGSWTYEKIQTSEYGSIDSTFATSSGVIKAASTSINGDGSDSTTCFTDGTYNYILYDYENDVSFYGATFLKGDDSEALLPATFISTHVVWIDGYFILNEVGTNKFWVSDPNSINIDALNFSSSEGNPDLVVGLIAHNRMLRVFNEKSTEVYINTGNADFPFERVQGGFIEIGCLAKYSIDEIDGAVFWLGRSKHGQGIIYADKGTNPQRISTHAIEQAISGYADPSAATAYTYQDNGHNFYVLNFTEATWVYDLSTGLWHERAYTNNGALERHRGEVHAYDPATGMHLVGDYESGKVYQFKDDYYSDNGDAITRLRALPHISKALRRAFYSSFQLDMEVGVGLASGQGSDPSVMLDWSDDGGHTWSSESWALADAGSGEIGDYKKRVIWRRLGSSRDRIFRVKITDPVKIVLLGAELEVAERGHG